VRGRPGKKKKPDRGKGGRVKKEGQWVLPGASTGDSHQGKRSRGGKYMGPSGPPGGWGVLDQTGGCNKKIGMWPEVENWGHSHKPAPLIDENALKIKNKAS